MKREVLNYTQNRELSWLRFNQRVLEEAQDHNVPLLERMKFVSIFTSNLDEFFMIRVGSLYDMSAMKSKAIDCRSGMNAKEQLEKIYEAVTPLYKERDKTYTEIKNQLQAYGVCELDFKDLKTSDKKYIKKYFKEQIQPVLSPQIVDANHPFPHLLNKEIYVVANLKYHDKKMFGIVPIPQFISKIVYLPGDQIRYIRTEKVILEYLDLIFEQYQISDATYACVTRNADISPEDEVYADTTDFRYVMQEALQKRRKMAVVRLEVANTLEKEMEKFFCQRFQITPNCIFKTKIPMKLDYISSVIDNIPESIKKPLMDPVFSPQPSRFLSRGSVMEQVKRRDVLLSYPYESMDPFLRLIKEASVDPSVMTIKITIYRLAKKARLAEYLCAAAENGKEVTVLIELRARFDEQNNIEWSERMEEAGCRVIYGFEEYKVHSKICLITYREKNHIRYITQIGTGNYNEKTAKQYTDYSLITANSEIGRDAALFFKNMSIGNLDGVYEHLLVSPTNLKDKILQLMDEEIKKGDAGRIVMKMNSVTDIDFIHKVAQASKAGVKIDLIVRGICCILPNIQEETINLTVTSIVGRYLEHPRVFVFGTGSKQKVYIGSADMMTRNTQKRVEVACPVWDLKVKKQLLHHLNVMLADNVKAREMQSDGSYRKKEQLKGEINSQEIFMKEALQARSLEKKGKKRRTFKRVKQLFHK